MSIGLTRDELYDAFRDSFNERIDIQSAKAQGAAHGENPEFESLINRLTKDYEGIPPGLAFGLESFIGAIMDAIEANNVRIAEQLSV